MKCHSVNEPVAVAVPVPDGYCEERARARARVGATGGERLRRVFGDGDGDGNGDGNGNGNGNGDGDGAGGRATPKNHECTLQGLRPLTMSAASASIWGLRRAEQETT